MVHGVSIFFLLVVLKDSETKTDVGSKLNTTAQLGCLMDAGRLRAKPDKKVTGDVRGDTDPDPFS
jgi:hypothetical protein